MKEREGDVIVSPVHAGGAGRFPVTARLKRRSDLWRVYRCGVARSGVLFSLHFLPREGEGRLGILVPRRWGAAVEKSRVKRLLREAFRRHRRLFAGVDLVVRLHEGCKGRRAEEVERLLVEEFCAARDVEVSDGQREDLPDQGGTHPHAEGTGPCEEDPV